MGGSGRKTQEPRNVLKNLGSDMKPSHLKKDVFSLLVTDLVKFRRDNGSTARACHYEGFVQNA